MDNDLLLAQQRLWPVCVCVCEGTISFNALVMHVQYTLIVVCAALNGRELVR